MIGRMGSAYDVVSTPSDAELLAHTRAAIERITVTGQAYTLGKRQLTLADLPQLWEQVTLLERRIGDDSGDAAENLARLNRR